MSDRFRRSLAISTAAHGVLVFLVIFLPVVLHLFHREKAANILMVDLINAMPTLPTPPEPTPTPVVESKPKPPEPPKPISEKPKIKVNTNLVKRAAVVQPQHPVAKKPPLTADEIRKILNAGIPQSGPSASVGEADAMTWYFALITATMYEAWEPPSATVAAGLNVKALIRVQRDGAISERRIVKGSGNAVMDASVMKALDSVSRLKPLPSEYGGSYKDITIDFHPSDTGAF